MADSNSSAQEAQSAFPTVMENNPLPQTVRFASVNQEIEPSQSNQSASQSSEPPTSAQKQGTQQEDDIRSLALGLHSSHIQQRRMSNFAFDPCSLPPSRVQSNESTPNHSTREPTRSEGPSPRTSPPASAMTTPPLSPRGTSGDVKKDAAPHDDHVRPVLDAAPQSTEVTPRPKALFSAAGEESSTTMDTSRPSTADQGSTRPTTLSRESSAEDARGKRGKGFALGPSASDSSTSRSREPSPSAPFAENKAGASTPPIRPLTPIGDKDDPYARSKRLPQSKNLDTIDPRFKFGANDSRRRSGINIGASAASSGVLPRSSSGKDLKVEHRKSTFSLLGAKDHAHDDKHEKHEKHEKHAHSSMSDLKRFFGLGSHHKSKRNRSPAASMRGYTDKAGTRTPPRQPTAASTPFSDDHGLEKKYGKFGKILGSGAGGSVRILKRASDNRTFAVKQFRDRHSYESPRDYNKKVTAEFCIGSTLHHGNIIETLDIVQEQGHWFEVMEYAPFDLFAIVMTGKMSREEVTCCFLQIVNGVAFLHASGLAHRDLKLDNVVVNEFGIMKIIDFGSASVFKYPFENDIIMASGVVGSDPYLAPEVYDERKYDPQPADIWSLAIIFACMTLRRFPWKAPRVTDNSYKLFIAEPHTSPDEARTKSTSEASHTPAEDKRGSEASQGREHKHHHHHQHSERSEGGVQAKADEAARNNSGPPPGGRIDAPKADVIRGPWRLLRLLPRETRPIVDAMLKIDPKKRATMAQLMSDPWVSGSPVCQQLEQGKILRAGSHTHHLEPGAATPAASAKG